MYNTKYTRVNPQIVKVVITPDGEQTYSVPMVILDVSGSMSGSRLRHCCRALQCFLQKGPIKLITFNDNAQYRGQLNSLPNLCAGGGTKFRAAFDALSKSEHQGPVIFMTDGEDGENFKPDLAPGTQLFTVGIEAQSQTQKLIDYARSSPIPGDYSYFSAENNNYAAEADLLSTKVRSAPIQFKGKEYYLADRLELFVEDSTTECESSCTVAVDYLAYQADLLVQQGENASLDEIKALRDQATELFVQAGKTSIIQRKQVRSALQPVYALLAKFYDLRHANMKISNKDLANLALSARDARTSRFAKMAVDRASDNEKKIAEQDQRLAELSAAFDPASIDLDYKCTLSHSSVGELLKDGSCIGIGVQTVPTEVCIADPTRLSIPEIGTSYFGCNEFLEASEWALPKGITFGKATEVVPDSSRNNVSAVLPLYLSPEHWEFAKQLLLRMVGHAACKDPLQGTLRHIVFTYLLAYQRAKTYGTEFHNQVAHEFALVLRHLPNILPTPEQFCQVQNRVTDSVPSFDLLELAWEVLELQSPPHYQAMKEEELLRRAKEPKSLVVFPPHWISNFVQANAPNGNGDLFAGLRSRLMSRPELLQKIPTGNENGEKRKPFEECATEVEPLPILSQGSPRRRALIALQAWRCPKSTDLDQYISYHEWSEEQVDQEWNLYCKQQLQQQRSAALTELINKQNNNSVEADLVLLQSSAPRNEKLLQWLAILTRSLYIGRNIRRYAEVASDLEHVKMLSGEYDAGPLFGLAEPLWISTINDKYTTWQPSTSKKRHGVLYRKWLAQWGEALLHVFPNIALRSNSVFLANLFAKKANSADYVRLFDAKGQDQCDVFTQVVGLPKYDGSLQPNLENMIFQLRKSLQMC